MIYKNPVRRGFYPDPSVIRVGDDYYMVNSSFQYFPCIPISHSKDMINWTTIGHAISDPSFLDLSDIKDSHGIWAPDIHYDETEQLFYITATLRLNDRPGENFPARCQLLMKSRKPEGPYSKPVKLPINAIDPSLFFDSDGKKYMITAKGAIAHELNKDCTKLIGEPGTVWAGTGERCSEGPHILKHGGYYYAYVAEGGTGYGHGINAARSKTLFGQYEECPYNPVMRQKDPEKPIQRAGHGKLIKDQNGKWWAYYLCGRRNGGNFTTLGRETALDPVRWTEDGWFLINEGHGPSETQTAPELDPCGGEDGNFFDGFTGSKFHPEWQFVRNPDYSAISLNGESPNHLRLYTVHGQMNKLAAKNILVHREAELSCCAETKLRFSPAEGTYAGLTCYYSTNTYIRFDVTKRNGKNVIELVTNRGGGETCEAERALSFDQLYLKVSVRGQSRRFLYSTDGCDYTELSEISPCTFLCDEGVPGDRKRHTGTMTGIFALADRDIRIPADFDYFKISVGV